MILKISSLSDSFSGASSFLDSSTIFHRTSLFNTILESLGWGEKGSVFKFTQKCLNKKWELPQGFEGISYNFLVPPLSKMPLKYVGNPILRIQ